MMLARAHSLHEEVIMATQREQLTAIRNMAEKMVLGNEPAAQYLYGIGLGSMTTEQADVVCSWGEPVARPQQIGQGGKL